MTNGILYIAFGKEYDNLTAHTVAFSRQFTSLPICILTNINEQKRHPKWKEVDNISFIYLNKNQNENRNIKTKMNQITPFDETLYLDCDSVITKPGIDKAFELLQNNDLVLNINLHWKIGEKVLRIYKRAMIAAKVKLPIKVYNGAFVCFRKNELVGAFFLCWNTFWIQNGMGREMPSLACSIKKFKSLRICELPVGFFAPDYYLPDHIVQHNYNPAGDLTFFERFNAPKIVQNKPFDHAGTIGDWIFEEFEQ